MKRHLRRSLFVVFAALALAAAALLWPRAPEVRVAPMREGEQEIVWLSPATSASAWERFVTAVKSAAQRLDVETGWSGFTADAQGAFPRQTLNIPEVVLSLPDGRRLAFRWYKLTSDQKAEAWVRALVTPERQPLAFIGGSDSDRARDLADRLATRVGELGRGPGPLLLLTTATADLVRSPAGGDAPLNALYEGRTFRFCFTNKQMAAAVTEFLVSRSELRPDEGPFYLVLWGDDFYSIDLTQRFRESLGLWGAASWLAITPGTGGLPFSLAGVCGGDLSQPPETIDYSVGGFDQPNRWEGPIIERILETKSWYPRQQRPLLVLSAPSSQPARRFLRGLARAAPAEARRFVVATGDALPFNTVYRDRNVSWPVQDLPFDLVFFCHRNPVDAEAGFTPQDELRPIAAEGSAPATGTEDLLLYRDIVEALALASARDDGSRLGERLRQARWDRGRGGTGQGGVAFGGELPLLFDEAGLRRSGTGEHVVWLKPSIQGDRARPLATLEVWAWLAGGTAGRDWELRAALDARYEAAPPAERR